MWLRWSREEHSISTIVIAGLERTSLRAEVGPFECNSNLDHEDKMTDNITYFGDPVRATDRNGKPIMVNGRPLLIPENFDLQNEINAAHYAATRPEGPGKWAGQSGGRL